MKALAGWYFGGGQKICKGHSEEGLPCAKGQRGVTGDLCPLHEHAPETPAGQQAWDVLVRCAGQVRTAGMGGVIGVDLVAMLTVADALGYERRAVVELLGYGEAGLMAAMSRNEDDAGDYGEEI